ncbi:MAG: hypothetical protein QNK36_04375 [Colwellia sp.]|nr:hypothetical protein [Colwellia sp.]
MDILLYFAVLAELEVISHNGAENGAPENIAADCNILLGTLLNSAQ